MDNSMKSPLPNAVLTMFDGNILLMHLFQSNNSKIAHDRLSSKFHYTLDLEGFGKHTENHCLPNVACTPDFYRTFVHARRIHHTTFHNPLHTFNTTLHLERMGAETVM